MEENTTGMFNLSNQTQFTVGPDPSIEPQLYGGVAVILLIWITGFISNVSIFIRSFSPRCHGLFGRRSLSVFVLHKSIADTMLLLSCPVHIAGLVLPSGWIFGATFCRLVASFDTLAVCLSTQALFMMGVERYTSVVRPAITTYRRLKRLRRSHVQVPSMWASCLLLTFPIMLVSGTYTSSDGRRVCGYVWPLGTQNYYQMYFGTLFLFNFICVYGSLSYMWYFVVKCSRETRARAALFSWRRDVEKHRAVIILVVAHCVCWFPFWVWQFVVTANPADPSDVRFGRHLPGGYDGAELTITALIYIPSSIGLYVFVGCIGEWRKGCRVGGRNARTAETAKRECGVYYIKGNYEAADRRRSQGIIVMVHHHVNSTYIDDDMNLDRRSDHGSDADVENGARENVADNNGIILRYDDDDAVGCGIERYSADRGANTDREW